MDEYYDGEVHWDGDGNEMAGLGDTTAPAITNQTPSWLEQLTSGITAIATPIAQIQASKQIAKTGQVPTAQVNVGVAPDTKKLVIYGGAAALGLVALYMLMKK